MGVRNIMKKKCVSYVMFFVIAFYSFAESKNFKSANDYLRKIEEYNSDIKQFEVDCEKEINHVKAIHNENRLEEEGTIKLQRWEDREKITERKVEFDKRKEKELKVIQEKYSKLEESEISQIKNKFENLKKEKEIEKNSLIEEMKMKEFILSVPDVKFSIGEFVVNAEPQHWLFTVTSQKKELDYSYQGQLLIDGTDKEKFAREIEATKEHFIAELSYKIEQNENDFRKKITRIYIKNSQNNAIIGRFELDEYENKKGFESKQNVANNSTINKSEDKNLIQKDSSVKADIEKGTKKVWVDTGWGTGKFVTCISGFTLCIAGAVLLPTGLSLVEPELWIPGAASLGVGFILEMITILLPNNGYYKEVVAEINSNPVLKNVCFNTNGFSTTLGYKITW